MSASVSVPTKCGIDFSKLTDGELFFINWLKLGKLSSMGYAAFGWTNDARGSYFMDFTKVTSAVVQGSNNSCVVTLFNSSASSSATNYGVPVYYSSNTNLLIAGWGFNTTNAGIQIYGGATNMYGAVYLKSFVTTDGKTHTATNLNY